MARAPAPKLTSSHLDLLVQLAQGGGAEHFEEATTCLRNILHTLKVHRLVTIKQLSREKLFVELTDRGLYRALAQRLEQQHFPPEPTKSTPNQ